MHADDILTHKDIVSLKSEKVEVLKIACIKDNKVLKVSTIGRGNRHSFETTIKDVFRDVFKTDSDSMIVFHNHPNWNSEESIQDIKCFFKIKFAAWSRNVKVIDNIIIGNTINSFKKMGMLKLMFRMMDKYVQNTKDNLWLFKMRMKLKYWWCFSIIRIRLKSFVDKFTNNR